MADCASLLDEELSSFVFSYLTEKSGSQYGEEEVCSDRLDADFPDIDLSQLDASDFDSVNCLSELHWCNDQSDASPASVQYSTGDQLFEIEEENAALLAALTDSLDGMVEDEVGGLSVFPSLGEELEEDEEDLPLDTEPFPECQSLLKKLLLTPPNVPAGMDANKEGSRNRHSNRSLYLKPLRPLVKNDGTQKCKARAVRPAGLLCTELHRHLTTAQEGDDTPSADTEEEEEDEDDDSDSEEDEDDEEDEEESSGSEVEAESPARPARPAEPPKSQFSSEKELHSMVELIKYMHTYCLPTRKQGAWERREREGSGFPRRARPEASTARSPPNCHKAAAPQAQGGGQRPRPAFSHQREVKANSLLRELLEAVTSFDVSKPYRLHSPPYIHSRGPHAKSAPAEPPQSPSQASHSSRPDLPLPTSSKALGGSPSPGPGSPDVEDSSFSVRRSRRLASFPSRFAKRMRQGRTRAESEAGQGGGQETVEVKQHVRTPVGKETAPEKGLLNKEDPGHSCCHKEKRSCLCLPLTPKSTGDASYPSKPFEQPLSMDLCGTAGLTPPTTPPHKSMEEELFKPEGKADTQPQTPNTTKGSWLTRANARKLPEQTELYAQLRRMGQASQDAPKAVVIHRTFGDHDYCLLSLGERRKRTAAALSPSPWGALERGDQNGDEANQVLGDRFSKQQENRLNTEAGEEPGSRTEEDALRKDRAMATAAQSASAQALSPQNSEEEGENPSSCRSPSPVNHTSCCPPQSPRSKSDFSCENDEACREDKQRNITKSPSQKDEDNCQVFYIHNLPSSVTQMMLRKRFQAFGDPEDCKVIIKNEERCGVIKIRQGPAGPTQRHRRETLFQNGLGNGLRRITRKRYIDLDEAGPGPVKSKYDALDFDTLLKEAQKSLHR